MPISHPKQQIQGLPDVGGHQLHATSQLMNIPNVSNKPLQQFNTQNPNNSQMNMVINQFFVQSNECSEKIQQPLSGTKFFPSNQVQQSIRQLQIPASNKQIQLQTQ